MSTSLKVSILSFSIFLLCCFLLSSSNSNSLVNAQFFTCNAVVNGSFYNLSSLTGTQISGNNSNNGWMYFMNVCAVSPACHEDGAMVCQSPSTDPSSIFDLAYPNDDVLPHFWTKIPGGIELTAFGSGRYCQRWGDYRRTIIHVYCNESITEAPKSFSGPVVEAPDCTYTFQIQHVSGCPLPIPATPETPTAAPSTGGGGDSNAVTGAGVGVGIIVGLIIALIFVGGYVIWKKRQAESSTGQFRKVGGHGEGDDKNVYLAARPHDGATSQTDD